MPHVMLQRAGSVVAFRACPVSLVLFLVFTVPQTPGRIRLFNRNLHMQTVTHPISSSSKASPVLAATMGPQQHHFRLQASPRYHVPASCLASERGSPGCLGLLWASRPWEPCIARGRFRLSDPGPALRISRRSSGLPGVEREDITNRATCTAEEVSHRREAQEEPWIESRDNSQPFDCFVFGCFRRQAGTGVSGMLRGSDKGPGLHGAVP